MLSHRYPQGAAYEQIEPSFTAEQIVQRAIALGGERGSGAFRLHLKRVELGPCPQIFLHECL